MKLWKKIGLGSVLVFGGMQVVTCERSNPPVKADLHASQDVKGILTRACYDCHSNETAWPWYTHVAPVSWLVHHDVVDGRAALNFSDWEALSDEKKAKLRRESGEQIDEGEMPPSIYRPLHPRASLSSADKAILRTWTQIQADPRALERDADGRAGEGHADVR